MTAASLTLSLHDHFARSAEDLTVFKLSFNRDKDWVDIRQLLVAGTNLDLDYVEAQLIALRGPSMHPRLARLRALARGPGPSFWKERLRSRPPPRRCTAVPAPLYRGRFKHARK